MRHSMKGCASAIIVVALLGVGLLAQEPCTITVRVGQSIQAAVDAAPEGVVICLTEGEWEEHLDIGKSLTLRGAGPDRTTIRGHERDVSVIRVQADQVVLEQLHATGASGRGRCLMIEGTSLVTITRCVVSQNGDDGIGVRDTAQVTMSDCTVADNKESGIFVWNTAQLTITDVIVQANGRGGVTLGDDAQATIKRSVFRDNEWDGITLLASSQLTISECEIQGNEGGIWMEGASQAVIVDTTITENVFEGIYMEESAEATITNCTLSDNEGGVLLVDGARATVINCTIADNAGAAVALAYNARITLEGNRIVRSAYWDGEGGYGVMVVGPPCTESGSFNGYVAGKANWIPGPNDRDGNVGGAVCPTELGFLMTEAGGELDRRE